MAELDAILEKYTNPSTGCIHGATFVAIDSSGKDIYRKSFGHRNVDTSNSPDLTTDTLTWMASQTKLATSVAVMQLVERGLIRLDDDVREVVPQLKELKVLTGFEGEDAIGEDCDEPGFNPALPDKPKGNPILEDLKGPITLRQMLTHSAGLCYDLSSPLLKKYSAWADRKEDMFSGTIEGDFCPLVYQPGTSWRYSTGLEWAGQVVEKITGINLDEYQQKNIWQPLGATNTTFYPSRRGTTRDHIQETGHRAEGEGPQNLKAGASSWKFESRDALGGGGLYSTADGYIKLLAALLAGGRPLLSKASVDEMFRPQLNSNGVAALREYLTSTSHFRTWQQTPKDEAKDMMEIQHCLCGVINSEDVKVRRRKNTIDWSGLPNCIWFIDRESGLAATFFTQIMPSGDPMVKQLQADLEEALYRIVNER